MTSIGNNPDSLADHLINERRAGFGHSVIAPLLSASRDELAPLYKAVRARGYVLFIKPHDDKDYQTFRSWWAEAMTLAKQLRYGTREERDARQAAEEADFDKRGCMVDYGGYEDSLIDVYSIKDVFAHVFDSAQSKEDFDEAVAAGHSVYTMGAAAYAMYVSDLVSDWDASPDLPPAFADIVKSQAFKDLKAKAIEEGRPFRFYD